MGKKPPWWWESWWGLEALFPVSNGTPSLPRLRSHSREVRLHAATATALVLMLLFAFFRRTQPTTSPQPPRFFSPLPPPTTRPSTHLVICSHELEHLTIGGAGVVVADTARALTLSGRWRVTLVLDLAPQPQFSTGRREQHSAQHGIYRRLEAWHVNAANAWAADDGTRGIRKGRREFVLTNLRLILLEDLLPKHHWRSCLPLYWRNSMLWAQGLQTLYVKDPFDAVEFFDYEAPAYHTLLGRMARGGGNDATNSASLSHPYPFQVWIRTHGLLQSIDDVQNLTTQGNQQRQTRQDDLQLPDRSIASLNYVYRMETRALQLADAVIANSPSIGEAYAIKQNLWTRRIISIPPTLGTLKAYYDFPPSPRLAQNSENNLTDTNILVYGKLQRVKGADVAARAIVQVMRELGPRWPRGVAIFAGDDVPCASDPAVNMSTCILRSIVREDLRHRFKFTGAVKRGEIGAIAAANHVRLAILPSRYETFCLAAHEVKHYGVPVLLPNLPAYRDYFVDESNALLFEPGSASDLARVLARAVGDDALISRLRAAPQFQYADPAKGYARLISD